MSIESLRGQSDWRDEVRSLVVEDGKTGERVGAAMKHLFASCTTERRTHGLQANAWHLQLL